MTSRPVPSHRPALVLLLCALLLPATLAGDGQRPVWIRVQLDEMRQDLAGLAAAGYDIAGVDRPNRTVDIVGTLADLTRLKNAGHSAQVVRYLDLESLEVDSAYTDPAEMNALMSSLESVYPDLARVVELGFTDESRPYRVMKISDNVMVDEDEPAIFFDFMHHAREVMTPEIARDVMLYLLQNYGVDSRVTDWVDRTEIWVIPIHNPDGLNHVFTVDDNWRKNRRNNGDGSFGVDVNRNYPWQWGECNGSSGATGSFAYRGPSAESEPETQALAGLARQERPVIDLTYHTYGEIVLYPYGCNAVIPSDKEASENLGHQLARTMVRDSGVGTYEAGYSWNLLNPVDGETKSWMLGELGIFSYTVEVNSSGAGGFLPGYAVWRDSTVERARPGWQHALDRLEGPSVRGHVTDACTGVPLEAEVGFDELPLISLEPPRISEPVHGRYQRLLLLGDYTLRISKTGYHQQAHAVSVRTSAVDREIGLVPLGSHGLSPVGFLVDDSATGDGDGILDPGETARLQVTARATGEPVTGITGLLLTSDPYLTILDANAAYPDLPAGGSSLPTDDGFQVTADPAAPTGHPAQVTVAFQAAETLCQPVPFLDVPITPRRESCPFVESLDADPGWSIVNTASTGWAFGAPTPLAFQRGPGSGATGTNVYGTNLVDFYGSNADHTLTTTPYDLTGLTGTVLELQRWISTEEGFDFASIEASADGVDWDLLWTGTASDRDWRQARIDASSMGGEPAALFRFRMRSDSFVEDGGFYLDDVVVCGEIAPALTAASVAVADDTANPSCTDGDGVADAGEIVTLDLTVDNRGVAPALGATVQVASGDPAVEILTPLVLLGDVPSGGQAVAAITVRVDGSASCGQQVELTADFVFNGGIPFAGASRFLTLEMDGASCDANGCPAACAPAAEIGGLALTGTGTLSWTASADGCHAVAGLGYRVYRAGSPAPSPDPPVSFPADTAFLEVATADLDGSLLDPAFDDGLVPGPGACLFYLVTDMGSNGERGPVGHYGN